MEVGGGAAPPAPNAPTEPCDELPTHPEVYLPSPAPPTTKWPRAHLNINTFISIDLSVVLICSQDQVHLQFNKLKA